MKGAMQRVSRWFKRMVMVNVNAGVCVICVLELIWFASDGHAGGRERKEKMLGAFGSPEVIWRKGQTLKDYNINAVFVGRGSLKPGFIERCRREGAKVFFQIGLFVGKELAKQHPELHPIGVDGKPMEPDEWYLGLCPTVGWYRQKKLKEIEETFKKFDVDGVWLDFLYYPCLWEVEKPRIEQACFNESCLSKFVKNTGLQPVGETIPKKAAWILRNHEREWTAWKCRQIADFCKEVKSIVERVKPTALLGIFSVPWTEEDFGNAIHKIIAQDFKQLARWVDVFSPMVYHLMCARTANWVGEYTAYLIRKTRRDVVPIVQASDHPKPKVITPKELEKVLRLPLQRGGSGVMVFTLRDVFKSEEKTEVLQRVYSEQAKISG